MQINVQAKGLTLTDALKDYAVKKLNKIEHFFQNIQQVEIELEVNNTKDAAQSQVAKVTVMVSGSKLHAQEISADMYASIDLLMDNIDNQVKKYKDKMIHEKRRESAKSKQVLHETLISEAGDADKMGV